MTAPGDDLHASDPSDFRAEVHSFQHWFDSVEGYLQGLEHGHRAGIPEPPLTESERDRLLSVLCTYCVGEEAALEASSGLVRIAPNHPTRIFLSTQVVDEARHVEVLFERIADLGVSDPEQEVAERSAPSIREFKDRLLRLVDAGEWISAIFAQNVMLETMEFIAFTRHARAADPVTRDVLERILRDERRHLGFGENEIGRIVARDARSRAWVDIVRRELDTLVFDTFEHAGAELGLDAAARPELGRAYGQAMERLGFRT